MNFRKINNQLVTFCALAVLFLGSLYYFVAVAFEHKSSLGDMQKAGLGEYAAEVLKTPGK